MTKLLLGKPVAEQIYNTISQQKAAPTLACVGFDSPQWQQYVRSLQKSAANCGANVQNIQVSMGDPAAFCKLVEEISASPAVDGVLLQQPLPQGYQSAVDCVLAAKDVDCLSASSVSGLYRGAPVFYPATPLAVLKLLQYYDVPLAGKRVVIVGRGNAVGKPLALMCLQQNATVTVCHSKTSNLPAVCREADVLISACGVAGLITKDFVTPQTVVVDVGLSFVDGKTCGDVAEEVQSVAAAVSPVPGGVGPVTRATLFANLAGQTQMG